MDKELRYGRVEIVESTSARVHVRWSYQSTDFNYKVWGDEAVEDYYFYPDGFGTRVVDSQVRPQERLRAERVHHPHAAGGLSVRGLAGRPGRCAVPRRPEASIPVPEPDGQTGRPRREQTSRACRPSTACGWQGREARGDLFQPERDQAAAGRLRAVLRRRPDGHSLLLGEPLAAGAGEFDRADDRRPDPVHPDATTA